MDIVLYGNVTIDTVIKNNEVYTSIGSIANVWDALVKLDSTKTIQLEPIEYGQALICIDTISGLKVSKPNLQIRYRTPTVVDTKWSHIAYINRLRDLNFITKINNSVISADIAGNTKFDFDSLFYVDYLFVADDEIKYLSEFLPRVKRAVIVHGKSGSITYCVDGSKLLHSTTCLSNKNILGAGDYFAAAFIVSMLNGEDLTTSLQKSHTQTFKHLENYE